METIYKQTMPKPEIKCDVELAKKRITAQIGAYKQVFHKEYMDTLEIVKMNRDKNSAVSATGNIQKVLKGIDVLERPAYQVSETLFTIFQRSLSPDELVWFRTNEATNWFMQAFPEFRLVEKF